MDVEIVLIYKWPARGKGEEMINVGAPSQNQHHQPQYGERFVKVHNDDMKMSVGAENTRDKIVISKAQKKETIDNK